MADRYLLESGSPDGYLLEDGSGVLLLEETRRQWSSFTDGQSAAHVSNLVGFAGTALLWASAAALTLFVPAQPQPQAAELTFGLHAEATAQASQSAQFFKASPGVFVAAPESPPPSKPYFLGELQQGNQSASVWGHCPALFIGQPGLQPAELTFAQRARDQEQPQFSRYPFTPAAVASVPIRQFIVGEQESPEQTAALFFGQEPRPAPVSRAFFVPGEEREPLQAIFWGGRATLFLAQSQFTVPARDSLTVEEQRLLDQTTPEFWRNFFAPVPIRTIAAAPQADPDQPQPAFSGQQPATALAAPSFKPFTAAPQSDPEQTQPTFNGQQPASAAVAPSFKPFRAVPQESPEQVAPFLFGQQPLPSPAVHPIWTAGEQEGSQSATIWGGNADLFIAAVQFKLPPRSFELTPQQESPEQTQPVVFGEQPKPSPPGRPLVTARDQDQASESATFWGSEATRFIAGTQFNLPPTDSRIVEQQRLENQEQPQFERHFFAPVFDEITVRQFVAAGQESEEQTQPTLARHYFAPVFDEITVRQFIAAPQESEEQTAPLLFGQQPASFVAPIVKLLTAAPQESREQPAPLLFGQQPESAVAPAPRITIAAPQESVEQSQPLFVRQYAAPVERPSLRPITAAPGDSQEQAQPAFSRAYFAPLEAPSPRITTAAPQESPEQVAPFLFGQQPAPAPSFKPWTAAPQESGEQTAPTFARQYFSPLEAAAPRPLFVAAPQEEQDQRAPQFYRQVLADVALASPPFRYWFVQDQYEVRQRQPVFVNLPLPDSQVVVPPSPGVGGGGDRDVNLRFGLFHKPEPQAPQKKKPPRPANFSVLFETWQTFTAALEAQTDFALSLSFEPSEFASQVEAESEFVFIGQQEQVVTILMTARPLQRNVPMSHVVPSFRNDVEFGSGGGEMSVKFEVDE